MLKTILFVDDDVKILNYIVNNFFDSEYVVLTAKSGEDAFEILENEKVNLIISDLMMPGINGYELLNEVKRRFPHVIRIILSEPENERMAFDLLRKNIAKLYILKPLDKNIILETITKVFRLEEVLKYNKNILKLINNSEELPTIKTSYQKIITIIENDEEIYKIVEAIECDNSIVLKLLHIVNSSYYALKTGSIKRAVGYLGLDNIKNIVITSAFIDGLTCNPKDNKRLEDLWKHAFISNRIMSIIYNEFLKRNIPETAMNAGLLSNVGIIFLIHSFHDKYMEIFDQLKNNNTQLVEFENRAFGTNHQEVGGFLLQWWDIPLPIVESALYHHDPFNNSIINHEIVYAAHIAEKYAWDILGENNYIEFEEKVFEELNIDKEKFECRIKESLELSGIC